MSFPSRHSRLCPSFSIRYPPLIRCVAHVVKVNSLSLKMGSGTVNVLPSSSPSA